jgi:ADP-heptose:LPS heptosyltransferase
LASTTPVDRASEILALCRAGQDVPGALLDPLVESAAGEGPEAAASSDALFGSLAEPLADSFDPPLSDAYAKVFSRVIAAALPGYDAGQLLARFERIRQPRHFDPEFIPQRVVVLSRVTLGADVAITSIILDAVRRRFPTADIYLAGTRKSWELFATDSRIRHLPISYQRRGTLTLRLEAGAALRRELAGDDCIVVDPDSRLTQLGLVPVYSDDRYFFFESRAYGGDTADSLSQLTKRWVAETFGVVDALPYVAPEQHGGSSVEPGITVSLGVGENQDKRIGGAFEAGLLAGLLKTGLPVLVDQGAGGEEAQRVKQAIAGSGAATERFELWDGSFAHFAARVVRSRLYIGYDSAGQHVAAATRTPFVSIFTGFPSERFASRWHPAGLGRHRVLRYETPEPEQALNETLAAVKQLLAD